MPRQSRLDAPGTLHHVIIRGIEKRDIVDDRKDRERFVSRMGELATETGTTIYAWALMTNHAHILLRSGASGLSHYMRRLLTGYAISYNSRHGRHGHLFQNRYKSIICEEEPYFLELVRYIHLNPLRAGMVKSLAGLDRYKWTGHGVLMDNRQNEWQNIDYVLRCFAKTKKRARQAYRNFVSEGVSQGSRPELVGGGLVRSLGGWSEVKAIRRSGIQEAGDERILGSGEFVEQLLKEAEHTTRRQFSGLEQKNQIEKIVRKICQDEDIRIDILQSGSRLPQVVKAREKIIKELVEESGVSLAETARQVGVSTSAVSKTLLRGKAG